MLRLLTLFVIFTILQFWITNAAAATNPLPKAKRGSGSFGKPHPITIDSKSDPKSHLPTEAPLKASYVSNEDKWAYKPDNRGKYVHVHIPYNGGYGPFKNPYDHDGRPYEHESDESKYVDDPFKVNYFDDKKPKIYREYGAPLFGSPCNL